MLNRKLHHIIFVLALFGLVGCSLTSNDETETPPSPTAQEAAANLADIPTVTINSPSDGSEVLAGEEVLIYSIARDSEGVTRIELQHNESVIDTINSPNPDGSRSLAVLQTWPVSGTGEQTLQVIAYRGEVASEPATLTLVVREQADEIESPAATPAVVIPIETLDLTCRARVNIDKLPTFAEPNFNASSAGELAIGTVIELIARTGDNAWWQTDTTVWVQAAYTTLLGDCRNLTVSEAAEVAVAPTLTTAPLVVQASDTPQAPTQDPTICRAQLLGSQVAVRREPASNAPILFTFTVPQDSQWAILQRTTDNAWVLLEIEGTLGWIAFGDIAQLGECGALPVATIPTATPSITATITATSTASETNTEAAAPTETPTLTLTNTLTETATLTETPTATLTASVTTTLTLTNTLAETATLTETPTATLTASATTEEVAQANLPPVIDPVPNQSVIAGETIIVPIDASDPEGFNVTIGNVESGSNEVAQVETDDSGNLVIRGLSEGQVNIRFTVTDNLGGFTSSIFTVEVIEQSTAPNQPPIVAAIPNQTLRVGEQVVIQLEATDPEGFNPFIQDITSAAETIATINAGTNRNIAVQGVSAGETLMTVTVSDGNEGLTTISFSVRVLPPPSATPNLPPVVEDVSPPTVLVGSTLIVPIIMSDPEGSHPFFSDIQSSSDQIVEAAGDDAGNIILKGISEGQAEVVFIVEDNFGGQTTGRFTVAVLSATEVPNIPPTVNAVPDQTVTVGEQLLVELNASDPEGFNIFLAQVISSDEAILVVQTDGNNNIVLEGVSPGETTVSATIDDGSGGQTTVTFNVVVLPPPTESPNQPPIVDPIPDQTVKQDEYIDVPVSAVDPEGFNPFIGFVYVEDERLVEARNLGNNTVRFTGLAGGTTEVGISVDDGNGSSFTVIFNITVEGRPPVSPNQPPNVTPIPDQRVGVGQTIAVFVEASDPEGFNLFYADITSAAPTIAEAGTDNNGNIWVTGVSAGTVEISATLDDSQGGQTTVTFSVDVFETATLAAGEPPQIAPIPPQTVSLGEFLPIAISAIDPEGLTVTLTATSSDETIAPVQLSEGGITIFGATEGEASINVIATDERGASSSVVFLITVTAQTVVIEQPLPTEEVAVITPVDVNTISVLPNWTEDLVNNLRALAANSLGQADSLLIAGNISPTELYGNGGAGDLDLSAYPEIAALLATYEAHPEALNTRANNSAWLLADLLNPTNNPPECPTAAHPVACAVELQQPVIALIVIGANDVNAGTPLEAFEADLNTLVTELTSRNVIPVLATIPGDATLVDPYNQAIARVAQNNLLPVVNLWLGIPAEQINPDLTLTLPPVDEALTLPESYGASQRIFYLLDVLTQLNQQLAQ